MRFLLALAAMTAVAQAGEPWPTFGNPYAFTEQGGEAVYRSVCAGCHMPEGHGARGAGSYPSLADNPRLAASGYPVAVVLKGQKAMPPFGGSLTDEQVAGVVGFIRTHFGNSYADAPTAADVAAGR